MTNGDVILNTFPYGEIISMDAKMNTVWYETNHSVNEYRMDWWYSEYIQHNELIKKAINKIKDEQKNLNPVYISEKNKLWGLNRALQIINEVVK